MNFFPTTSYDVFDFTSTYGNNRKRTGICSEHVGAAVRAGLTYKALSRSAVVFDSTGRSVPVLCSELIRVDTEDGPVSGRCGSLADLSGLCDRHTYEA